MIDISPEAIDPAMDDMLLAKLVAKLLLDDRKVLMIDA